MKSFSVAALAALCLVTAAPVAAKLTPAETRMLATVKAEEARTVAMIEKLVNQNSGSLNLPGVEKVGQMLRSELETLGFVVEWRDMKAAGRAGHLVARHVPRAARGRGDGRSGGKRLLLIAHMDTVFEPDSPFQRWTRRGDIGEGPGAVDDKGGIVVMIAALRAMQAAGTLDSADIEIVLSGDEEDSGLPLSVSRGDLVAAGKRADAALEFEALLMVEGRELGSIARRSAVGWTLTATGRTGHSGGIFSGSAGYGANYELIRILDAFRRELRQPALTYNVGLIGGGATTALDNDQIRLSATGKTNVIAATASARGDLRGLTLDQVAKARATMQAIVAQSLPGTSAKLTFDEDEYPPMAPSAGNRALLARLNMVNADMGLAPMGEADPMLRGAGDIGFVAGEVDGLVGLGPSGAGSHAAGETVDIPSITRQAGRAAILMSRLAAEKRQP